MPQKRFLSINVLVAHRTSFDNNKSHASVLLFSDNLFREVECTKPPDLNF